MEALTVTSLVVASCALVVAVAQLVLAGRQERRTTKRSDVEWSPVKKSAGEFEFVNTGLDEARRVTVEAWTEDEWVRTTEVRLVAPGEVVRILLPKREAAGPTVPSVMKPQFPRVPDESPVISPVLGDKARDRLESEWRQAKQMQDLSDAMHKRFEEEALSRQVTYRIIWAGPAGSWNTTIDVTG